MTVVNRYNSKLLYFPESLLRKLDTVYTEALTIVEAPLGYGKTTAIKHFFEESDCRYVWINVEVKDKFRFYDDFCTALKLFDETISDKLKTSGYPFDEDICNKNISILRTLELTEPVYFIIDNYQNVTDEMMSLFFTGAAGLYNSPLKVVLLTHAINDITLREMAYSGKVNYISKHDFEFTSDEIERYYRRCGIKITHEEADYLEKYTDGWISAIYLQLLHYIENRSFERGIGVNTLIGEMFWERLDVSGQDLLIKLGVFESFTIRQALKLAAGSLNETQIKKILSSNGLIRYDSSQRRYYIHGLLRYFLKAETQKLEPVFKRDIYVQAGKWCDINGEYFDAIKYYYMADDYEDIYGMHFTVKDIEEHITGKHKDMFMNIIKHTPDTVMYENPEISMVMCLVLFVYHEKDFYMQICTKLYEYLLKKQENGLIGEIHMLFALGKYNKIDEMRVEYENACKYIKGPISKMSSEIMWTFGTPSVLCNIYRSEKSITEQLNEFEKLVPYYYRLTGGYGKGADAMAKAEALLYSMDFESAEILCQKALYMAETRQLFGIYVSAMFCLARISVYKGDYENIKFILQSVNKKMEDTKEYRGNVVVDMAVGYIKILLGVRHDVPGWLKDNGSIEKKCAIYNIGFANLIYGKYLNVTGQYTKLLGISGQMLGISGIYDNVLYKIYTYLYIAEADYEMGHKDKSHKFIKEAIALASNDEIYLPFIENATYIKWIFEEEWDEYRDFVEKIREYDKIYGNKINIVEKNNHGLTKREEEIAKLASGRFTNKEIALKLHISENTVKSNLKNVFGKLDIKSRAELNKIF